MVVVSAWPVGAGEPDVELFLVVRVPREVQLDLSDVDHCRPVTGEGRSHLHGTVGIASGHEKDVVGTEPACKSGEESRYPVYALRIRRGTTDRPCALCHLASFFDDVDADDPHTCSDEQLHGELSDEAEADDTSGVSELCLTPPHSVHRDRPDGSEGSQLRLHPFWYRHAQVERVPS